MEVMQLAHNLTGRWEYRRHPAAAKASGKTLSTRARRRDDERATSREIMRLMPGRKRRMTLSRNLFRALT
jgi:hypothetical protein